MMKPALLVQDIQNAWLYEPDSNQDLRRSVERRLDVINQAIAWFRRNGFPVIVGYTEDEEQGLVPGARAYEVPGSVRVQKDDLKATKRHASAFGNPEFGAMLKREGCGALVIVGLSASGCVLGTYWSAFDWGVRPFLIEGGVASHNEEHVRFAEEICETVRLDELDSRFGRTAAGDGAGH
jgi:nicotinamidase-related amidase